NEQQQPEQQRLHETKTIVDGGWKEEGKRGGKTCEFIAKRSEFEAISGNDGSATRLLRTTPRDRVMTFFGQTQSEHCSNRNRIGRQFATNRPGGQNLWFNPATLMEPS
ncbi:MAG: hypothetical protein KDA81_18490, partial [Planctomycetaceae bacterium]|nr:hypothetical protein [Planctomycetaceae bacterium]